MNSKLDTALYLAKQGFKLFPLIHNGKIPQFKKFTEMATTDEKQITTWFTSSRDFNIGISTNDLLVVDVDVKNPEKNGIETIEKMNAEGKIFPPTKQQITTTNGLHFIYNTPVQVKNSVSKLGPGLDVRGRGGFLVGAGSIVNGKKYKINRQEVTEAPDWLIEACEAAREENSKAHEVAAEVDLEKAIARAEKYLRSLDTVGEGNRNDDAYKTAAKLKDIGLDKATTLYVMSEEWKCEPPLEEAELAHAINSAFTYGKDAQGSASPEALFGEAPKEEADAALHPIEELNKEYAFILMGSGAKILRETKNALGNFNVQFLDEHAFHTYLAAENMQKGDGTVSSLSRMWIRHPKRRAYDGLTFSPERSVSSRFYNLWRGFQVEDLKPGEAVTEVMQRAVNAFESHIFENVVNMDIEHFNWVMGWFAHMIQRPWEKPGTALVLKGRKGVGKNAIFETIRPMFPDHYLVSGDRKLLTGSFNGHMERLLMFVADEAFWSGDKASEGVLKSLITDPRINIERKGVDTISIESCHRIAILGNDKWVVPASDDERRYAVFNMQEGRKQDGEFFGQMEKDMCAGGIRYLFHKLKNFDLKSTNIRKIPMTEGLIEQKRESSSVLAKWWFEGLQNGFISNMVFDEKSFASVYDFGVLMLSYEEYARRKGQDKYLDTGLNTGKILQQFCPSLKLVKPKGGTAQIIVPDIGIARAEWEKYIGGREDWL